MGVLKNIWITLFGKSKKQEEFGRGGSIEEPKMKLVHKQTIISGTTFSGKIGGYTSGDVEPDKSKSCHPIEVNNFCNPNFTPSNHGVCNFAVTPDKLESREELIDSQITFEVSKPKAKKACIERPKGSIMTKEQAVLEYLLKYRSIDKRTCAEKFGLKRLDNVICELRKQGMNIKNETVELHNELGEKTKVNNYRLVASDGTN